MKVSGECASLDLDVGSRGATTQIDLSMSFNVDMRQLLGDMYEKYDHFLIIFNSIGGWSNATSYSTTSGTTGIAATATWTLGMTGLDWEATTYNGLISNLAYFPTRFTLPVGGYGSVNFVNNSGVCFRKPLNPYVTLTIAPYLTRGNSSGIAVVAAGNTAQVDFNYSFSIYGLYDD